VRFGFVHEDQVCLVHQNGSRAAKEDVRFLSRLPEPICDAGAGECEVIPVQCPLNNLSCEHLEDLDSFSASGSGQPISLTVGIMRLGRHHWFYRRQRRKFGNFLVKMTKTTAKAQQTPRRFNIPKITHKSKIGLRHTVSSTKSRQDFSCDPSRDSLRFYA